jgi:hypothetical protein
MSKLDKAPEKILRENVGCHYDFDERIHAPLIFTKSDVVEIINLQPAAGQTLSGKTGSELDFEI